MEELIGQILDHYEIVQLLGEGGMGAVFKARDVTLQIDVAIKVMHPHIARQPGFPERFLQEARSAARLDHPGIVRVSDFRQQRNLLYIVMEFIPGANLRDMLQDLKEEHKWVPLDEAVELVRQVSLALDYAHNKGVLHRDIKPSNIMLEPEPSPPLPYRPVLTDLGLARLVDSERITKEGTSLGTPAYMSPEQALGQPTDARSDVYSLGVLLFELAVGRPPFPARTITEAIRYHTKEPPPSPRSIRADLPQALEDVILKALEKQPQDRYPDAAALSAALQGVRDPVTEAAAAPTAMETSISLTTVYEKSLVQPRGPSVLKEFETPPDLSQDWIQILAADKSTRSVAIKGEVTTIGRQEDRDLVLDDAKASRQHARIEFDGSSYQILDLNSTNGTYLGDAKLLPGIAEVWTPDKPVRIGDTVLRLVRARKREATDVLPDGTEVVGGVGIYIKETQLQVEPGSSTAIPVVVFNQGPEVEHFTVTVNGIPDEWWESSPADIQLMPGRQQEATLTFHPPRSPQSRAGPHPITVIAASAEESAEQKGTLTVGAYSQFRSALHPQKIAAGATAQVTVQNQGNRDEEFSVEWQDRAAELAFQPPQAQLTAPVGQEASSQFRATPRQRSWFGGHKMHPISVQVRSAQGEAQIHTGQVVSKGRIPIWLPPLAALLLALLFWKWPEISNLIGPGRPPTEVAWATPTYAPPPQPSHTARLTTTPVPTPTDVPRLTDTPPPTDTPSPSATTLPAPMPTLIKGPGDPIYLVENGVRHWIPNIQTFEAMGYRLETVTETSWEELLTYPVGDPMPILSSKIGDGALVKGAGSDVYLIEGERKRHIVDWSVFLGYGYQEVEIAHVTDEWLATIPDGAPITDTPASTTTPTPRPRTFGLRYHGCISHNMTLGSVKGQVFDKSGRIIPGAKVGIKIDGYYWNSPANPATTNSAGWYEWTLQVGQRIEFVELIVDGVPASFSPYGYEVLSTSGCFQHVDFREQ